MSSKKLLPITAGYPWRAFAKIACKRAESGGDYADITDPADIPSHNWELVFVGPGNDPAVRIPLDWSQMTAEGFLQIELTSEQTLALEGQYLHLEVRNDDGVSDLLTLPDETFFFTPNKLYSHANS